jgi:GntR family transcriptional repressor for pyruvate dehydrogenase complex
MMAYRHALNPALAAALGILTTARRSTSLLTAAIESGMMGYQKIHAKEFAVPDSSSHAFRSIPRELSLSDKVAQQLTDAIMANELPPGEKLPSERALCVKFNVSRTVVREAVRSLTARGLVRVTSGRGVEVSKYGASNVADSMRLLVRGRGGLPYSKVNEVRMALEVQTAGLAAERATPEMVALLEQICDDHERHLSEGDLTAAREQDFQFHLELTRAADNELLLAMLDSISDVLREVRNQGLTRPHVGEEGLRAHRRILKAVKAGNRKGARAAMAEHLAEAERVWQETSKSASRKDKRK